VFTARCGRSPDIKLLGFFLKGLSDKYSVLCGWENRSWRPFLYSSSTVTRKELTLNETHKLLVHADDDDRLLRTLTVILVDTIMKLTAT
jgi:hypothetical protein